MGSCFKDVAEEKSETLRARNVKERKSCCKGEISFLRSKFSNLVLRRNIGTSIVCALLLQLIHEK